jgi:hypothetical protein
MLAHDVHAINIPSRHLRSSSISVCVNNRYMLHSPVKPTRLVYFPDGAWIFLFRHYRAQIGLEAILPMQRVPTTIFPNL